jgi:outer membrane immunogenic protein
MKKILLGAAGLVAALSFAAPASAADLPARTYTKAPAMVAAIYDWSGFYIGINGGGGSAHNCWNTTYNAGAIIPSTPEGCNNSTGGFVGGQLGYRWQSGEWVFGVEVQGDWADFKGSNASLVFPGITNQSKLDAFGLFTGQVGYAWNNVLWYVKGGAAVTDNKFRGLATVGGALVDQENDTRWGGTVGTGVEVSFAPNWSVAFEYDHLFMASNSVNFNTPLGVFTRTDSITQNVDIGSVRVNYRWGGPVIAKY